MNDSSAGKTGSADLELLRRHEPIVRYTRGETFFPMEVGTYLAHATLWERDANGQVHALAQPGELNETNIGELVAGGVDGPHVPERGNGGIGG